MTIESFAEALEKVVRRQRPSAVRMREADFEFHHVIKPAWKVAARHPEIHLCVHPSSPRKRCLGGCKVAAGHPNQRRRGCPDCWRDSKGWSVIRAYGLKHNFDLVARDARNRSMAVEVKWLSYKSGRGPNSEFQRFVGQCMLAAARHSAVLGICCVTGQRGKSFTVAERHLEKELEKKLNDKLDDVGVRLVVLRRGAVRRAG